MPCVPSYHEQMWNQASLGLQIARQELERLVPKLEQAKVVVADALAQAPELADRREADGWLERAEDLLARARGCSGPAQAPSTTDEVEAWSAVADERLNLYRAVEQHVCEAGALAWRVKHVATPAQKPAWDGLLTHHEDHREADRRAMLAELRRQLADLEQRYDAALDAARRVVHASGEFFDDATSREDAVRAEAGPTAEALYTAQRQLRARIERIKGLSLDELCADRDAL